MIKLRLNIRPSRMLLILVLTTLCLPAKNRDFTNIVIRKEYMKYGKLKKEVKKVFDKRTIERHLDFTMNIPDKKIFDELFQDLTYAVAMARKHARKKYVIYRTNDHFMAFDGYSTYANIHVLHTEPANSRYVFYCSGIYKGWVDVKGSMVIDVNFRRKGNGVAFHADAYVRIWNFDGVLHLLRSWFDSFEKKINKLVDSTVNDIWRTGMRVARTIYFERTGIKVPIGKPIQGTIKPPPAKAGTEKKKK